MMNLTYHHRCTVCRREIDGDRAARDTQRADFVGAMPWALCVCGMEMAGTWTPAYRQRWLRALREREPEEELAQALLDVPDESSDNLCSHARVAADEVIYWLADAPPSGATERSMAMAEAWATRCLGYIRRERARLRGGAP